MNYIGVAAVALSVICFAATHKLLGHLSTSTRIFFLCCFALLAVPSVWFAIYYLHVLPEYEWFYTLRSWRGSEFLVVFLGCAVGVAASLIPRTLLGLPLFAVLVLAVPPYIKPLVAPLPVDLFHERWEGDVCLQSTASTCGPASVTTILRHLGVRTTEQQAARAAYSYAGGTEAWYLARYVRSCGLSLRFVFHHSFAPEAGQPALVGVRAGGAGHFIAVLDIHDGRITFADPCSGERCISLAEFQRRYDFTGFHMVIKRAS
jgi:predicted double-glycine peptidase